MGITWKAMPLLSTLAALVIIVHSAQEDFEPDYREVRPRRVDTATTNYEQPWKILNMEPLVTIPTQADWTLSSQEEPPRRRRQGRKRKRRPPPTSDEDLVPQERHVHREEYRPYQQENINTQIGVIRRRRKQFDSRQSEHPNTWTDETVNADRPLIRKRGNKRKRLEVDETWPEFSEFNGFRPNDNNENNNDNVYGQPTESTINEDNDDHGNNDPDIVLNDDTVIKSDSDKGNPNTYNNYYADDSYNTKFIHHLAADNTDISNYKKDEDKSLSEFSLEIQPPSDDIRSAHEKLNDKAVSILDDIEKQQSNETLDPQTLKEILKKSNGRSLSEILQQHNLSLVDLLHGKEKAISILIENSLRNNSEVVNNGVEIFSRVNNETHRINNDHVEISKPSKGYRNRNFDLKPKASNRNTVIVKNISEDQTVTTTQISYIPESNIENKIQKPFQYKEDENLNPTEKTFQDLSNTQDNFHTIETTTKLLLRRRFPVGGRKKLRMRPMNNTTYKSQLNRDLIAMTSRRYQLSRNTSRSREWQEVMPTAMIKRNRKDQRNISNEKKKSNQTMTTFTPEEITVPQLIEDTKLSTLPDTTDTEPSTINSPTENISTESIESLSTIDLYVTEYITPTFITTISTDSTTSATTSTTTTTTTTEKPIDKPVTRPIVKASDLRRQAFNNRLKRKRLKQKTTTTDSPQEYPLKDIFGMANLVSASEFIAKAQPRTTLNDEELDFTTLEDFITTESTLKSQTKLKSQKTTKSKYSTTTASVPVQDMEETAKIEIEEILNDTHTSARLSKILMERNMTINELVEHRERGSSHIHLADIFHNASREPNPPEPFLSKSLIEPISKETYPLRALLEANLHDPTAKAISLELNSTHFNNINIPVVMDFGNNVNENGENMGIMSLFDNFTKITQTETDLKEIKDQPIEVNPNGRKDNSNYKYESSRESRTLNTNKDLVTWKEIIEIMHRGQKNNTNEGAEFKTKEISPALVLKKIVLDDLDDEDDSIITVNDFDRHISIPEKNIAHDLREKEELPQIHGVPSNASNSAKSVTVATASIIGLAMVLFLLTYVAFRWKQQRNLFREKENLRRERIPTPVFENRKGHRINSSTRSKSPMISSSNIYSIDTSDMRNGNDSPEYMWDSLRKPFQ